MNSKTQDNRHNSYLNTVGYDLFSHVSEAQIVEKARDILQSQVRDTDALTNPEAVAQYLVAQFAGLEHEVFSILLLDNRHRVLRYEELFRGTIESCSVHPREVVKASLYANAAAIIFSHNHPSGEPEPSRADIQLTKRLTEALGLIDIRVLDHIVVGGIETVSFAQRGLI